MTLEVPVNKDAITISEMDLPERCASPILNCQGNGKRNSKKQVMIGNGIRNGIHKLYRIPIVSTAIVEILSVVSPNEIWVRPFNYITDQMIVQEPFNYGEELEKLAVQDVQINMYCLAPLSTIEGDKDGELRCRRYGRARILTNHGVKVLDTMPNETCEMINPLPPEKKIVCVFYIDEGRREWVLADCLAKFPDKFCFHPWQSICISLGGIFPRSLYGERAEYWHEDDVIALRSLLEQYTVFSANAIQGTAVTNDYGKPIVVNLHGLFNPLPDIGQDEGVCIASQLVAERYKFLGRSKLFNADTHQEFKPPKVSKEIIIAQEEYRKWPLHWHTVELHDWQKKQKTNTYEPGEERGWRYDPTNEAFQIKHIDINYLNENKFMENGSYSFCILGSYTRSPYEFYGMPIHTIEEDGSEISCSQAMGSVYKERKDKARILDAFYSNKDNRFPLEKSDVENYLKDGHRVYAISHCLLEKRSRAGTWQRVEIISVDDVFYRIRYLDSGGQARVQSTVLFKIFDEHCNWPSLAVQLCWHGVKDGMNCEEARSNRFTVEAISEFIKNFRDDGPVRMNVYGQNPNFSSVIYTSKGAPEPFKMWNTLSVANIELCASSTFGEETNLLKILKFGGKPKAGRLQEDPMAPFELWDTNNQTASNLKGTQGILIKY